MRGSIDGVFDVWSLPSPNGSRFDSCGYVKGWSVQRAARLLRERGVVDFCLNAGGDVLLGGCTHNAAPWRVGVRHTDDAMKVALTIESQGPLAIATSGTYERGAHIVDCATGGTSASWRAPRSSGPTLPMPMPTPRRST